MQEDYSGLNSPFILCLALNIRCVLLKTLQEDSFPFEPKKTWLTLSRLDFLKKEWIKEDPTGIIMLG